MFCVFAFVFRVFDFRLLSFMFCFSACMYNLAPPRRTRVRKLVYTYFIAYIASNGVWPQVLPTTQDRKTKAKTQNLKVKSLKHKTQNILTQNTMSFIGFRRNMTLSIQRRRQEKRKSTPCRKTSNKYLGDYLYMNVYRDSDMLMCDF